MESRPREPFEKPPSGVMELGHEPSEVRARGFVVFVICFIISALLSQVFLWWVYGTLHRQTVTAPVSPLIEQHPIPPEPVQQGSAAHTNSPAMDLQHMHQKEDEILNNYGWVDRNKGIIRVPIDRAMQMTIEQGLPTRKPEER
jgi:hypothetical protein